MSRTIALLPNPVSGTGRNQAKVAAAATRLRHAGLAVTELSASSAVVAEELARQAADAGVDALVVCGGDGMVNLAAQVLAGTDIPLGLIPLGTGNDAARALDIPRHDVLAAADLVIAGRTRRIDLARAGERYFVTVMAAGFDAAVNEEANAMTWPPGRAKYSVAILRVLRRFEPISYVLELDGTELHVEGMLVAVGNSSSLGGGLRITHGADLADGLLDVVLFHTVGLGELVTTYPKLFKGTHITHPAYEHHHVRKVTVAAPGVVAYADGERLGELPLTVEVVPAALSVLAPP